MTAYPVFIPVTTPVLSFTEAYAGISDSHVTVWLSFDFGYTVAVSVMLFPTMTMELPSISMLVAIDVTFSVVIAVTPLPSVAVAVMTAEPSFFTVTLHVASPLSVSAATVVSSIDHVTICEALSGLFTATRLKVSLSVSGSTPIFFPLTQVSRSSDL